jgi:sulfonate transport system ATP-binding protein
MYRMEAGSAPLGSGTLAAESVAAHPVPEVLTIGGLSKTYRRNGTELVALSDINLSVAAGSITCIVGASGGGKSTLLRIIAGLDLDYVGTVLLDGHKIQGAGLDRGVVFQDHRLIPWMTVEQNIGLGLHRLAAPDREQAIDATLALVGLSTFRKSYPSELSGGMAQRIAIARALAHRPRLLLLDEPFGALDAMTKMRMQDELLRICATQHVTTIMITHDVEEAIYLGDKVVVLSSRPGRVKTAFQVDMPKPRNRASSEFVSLRQSLYDSFFQEDQP